MKRLLPLILLTGCTPVLAAALPEAFEQATQFGHAASTAAGHQIRNAAPQATVPGYTGMPTETQYFGYASLGADAASRASSCTTQPGTPDPQCAAIEFSQTNAGRRPTFSITPTDPLLSRAKTLTADPHRIAGNLAGTYSGCTTRTVTTPDLFETHFCNEYRVLERQSCEKTLQVTVTDNGLNCVPGTLITPNPRIIPIRPNLFVGAVCADDTRFQWTYYYSECNGIDTSVFVTTTVPTDAPIRMPVNLGCGGQYFIEGSCPEGNCSYRVVLESCDEWCGSRCCKGYGNEDTLADFVFTRPKRTYTVTDTWNDQCAAYEARLP